MTVLIIILVANLCLAALYVVRKGLRWENVGVALFFVFLPVLGFLIYFVPAVFRSFMRKQGVDEEAVLTHVFEIERQPEHPDVKEALDVVPVEDAMAVSDNSEKRALLLKQLKKDLKENYKILLAAEEDEDSESAHYVAAAKMEMYRLQQSRWLECRREYEEDPDDPERFHTACAILMEMLSSGVFSAREQNAYRKRLCELVQERLDSGHDDVLQSEYEGHLASLVELGRSEDAELFWREHAADMRSEATYKEMLKLFYKAGEREKFEQTLDDLCNNRQVRLSPKGLEQLRYWSRRLAGEPVG